ncbi:MAG: ABC transporter ATP-binding protein [Caldilineaceae bacterium]
MRGKWAIYWRLLGYLRPHWREVVVAYGSMLIATVLSLLVPQLVKNAIDRGLTTGNARTLFMTGGLILGVAVVRGIVSLAQRFYGDWLTYRVSYDLRGDFYISLQSLPFAFHDQAKIGDLMSRVTSDIGETERFIGSGLMSLVATVLLLVGVAVAMFLENFRLTLWTIVPLITLVWVAVRFGGIVRPLFRKIQDQMGILSSVMQESLTGIGVVKAFAREPYELEKFDRENATWFDMRYESIKVWAHYWPLFNFVLAIAIFLLLWFGGPQALRGQITVGTLFAMISYSLMLNAPVSQLGFLVNMATSADASASRVFEIIDTPNEVIEPADAVALENPRGEVRFENVSFAYRAGRSILREVNFVAQPNQVVALIGPTGSGKSTITNLIPRFYDPSEGRVLVDGVDIRRLQLKNLRSHIGIVLQEPFLFNATIAENIAYGRPEAPMEEIVAAAKAASAHDFIEAMPKGYETMVGERGVTLSGGQKQRLAIARALLYDPRILILDDSTSSVDTETEHLIQQALSVLMKGRTTFVIAQRLVTLKGANLILVLDHGRIVERGTHDELLAHGGLYRTIYDLQLKDQEEFLALQRGKIDDQSVRRAMAMEMVEVR